VPASEEIDSMEPALVESGAAMSAPAIAHGSSNGKRTRPSARRAECEADVDLDIVEQTSDERSHVDSRLINLRHDDDLISEPWSPEVPDSVAADDADEEPAHIKSEEASAQVIEVASPLEPTQAASSDEVSEAVDFVESDFVEESLKAIDDADDADDPDMHDLVEAALEEDAAAHPTLNGKHEVAPSDSRHAPSESTADPDSPQTLEQVLDDLAPVIQRQLGAAVAQYSAREQARTAMFARAVVDVHLARLSVNSHEGDRIELVLRYRRTCRRTVVGTKSLPNLTVEASFVRTDGKWMLDDWKRVHVI
jgi:hypothetical protein